MTKIVDIETAQAADSNHVTFLSPASFRELAINSTLPGPSTLGCEGKDFLESGRARDYVNLVDDR